MRAVVTRVSQAQVDIAGQAVGSIGQGLLVLLGITHDDSDRDVRWLAEKIVGLRIFGDDAGKMNRDVMDVAGSILVVSQFTLYGDCKKGRRPSFVDAAPPPISQPIYEAFLTALKALGVPIAAGRFGADMQVESINDGPVTLVIDSK
jgi:D-aminoacyl-tRNA deacylase